MPTYLRYAESVETVPPDEPETIARILESLHRLGHRTGEREGHAIRVSHAKMHGAATGELVVAEDLPAELRQGLFASPGRYPVIARLANVPGEIMGDAVQTQRGLSLKVLGVSGEMLPGHEGEVTQDFVLDTGNRFAAADAKAFLLTHLGLEHAPQAPEKLKEVVSRVARAANVALHAVGTDSANLDFFGHPRIHPLAEAYFTQAPIRYGEHVAKLAVVPTGAAQHALEALTLDTAADPDALRTATVTYLREHDASFDVRVQLCTDLESMPVEDASRQWSEAESPYVTVATLTLPVQEALSPERVRYVEEVVSFRPAHCLVEHRPLGSLMRARLQVYSALSAFRHHYNSVGEAEPARLDAVPD